MASWHCYFRGKAVYLFPWCRRLMHSSWADSETFRKFRRVLKERREESNNHEAFEVCSQNIPSIEADFGEDCRVEVQPWTVYSKYLGSFPKRRKSRGHVAQGCDFLGFLPLMKKSSETFWDWEAQIVDERKHKVSTQMRYLYVFQSQASGPLRLVPMYSCSQSPVSSRLCLRQTSTSSVFFCGISACIRLNSSLPPPCSDEPFTSCPADSGPIPRLLISTHTTLNADPNFCITGDDRTHA